MALRLIRHAPTISEPDRIHLIDMGEAMLVGHPDEVPTSVGTVTGSDGKPVMEGHESGCVL